MTSTLRGTSSRAIAIVALATALRSLAGPGVAKVERNADNIVDAGEHGQGHGDVKPKLSAFRDPDVAADFVQQHEEHRANLGDGVGFAQPTGTEHPHGARGVEHSTDNHDDDVTAEDQHGYRQRDLARSEEHQKHGAEEKLVGDGVEILPE